MRVRDDRPPPFWHFVVLAVVYAGVPVAVYLAVCVYKLGRTSH